MELTVLQSKIFEIRGIKVLLDFDLALLYEVENRTLKQSVRRNEYRFPKDFYGSAHCFRMERAYHKL